MQEKHLTRRWNDNFPIIILILASVFVNVALAGLVEGGFNSYIALVVIGGVG
jgi:hypothetical protein